MAKRGRNDDRLTERPNPPPSPRRGAEPLGLATLGGVVILLMISFSNWRVIDRIQGSLDSKLGEIERRIAQVSDKVDKVPAAQPARRGPDPNRVYQVKTAGAPAKGPADAPVTIAEFSDFQ
jgi:hypothetical protein